MPSFAKRDKGACIHCHSVNTSLYEEARDADRLDADWIWKYPSPRRVGLDVDRVHQRRVVRVEEDSAAARAGLVQGDELVRVGGTPVATATDLMHALEVAPAGATSLAVVVEREGTQRELALELEAGWKRGSPRELAWRPTKWAMTPAPGFGGPRLGAEALRELGLDPGAFAFRVTYLVTWGDNQRYGQAAARAGLRVGDVVTSLGGTSDFESIDHVHAWWRLTVEPGEVVEVELLRDGERRVVRIEALP